MHSFLFDAFLFLATEQQKLVAMDSSVISHSIIWDRDFM